MSQSLEKRVLELEITNILFSLKWSGFWVLLATWFIISHLTSTQWLFAGLWTLVGGLHIHSGVNKWQKYKALKEKKT